ncbi:MAG TPA: hypothetical protein VFV19_02750 [Candidatus Polarisedimenticolaceae bacterium]|nr:hypothetical protein [Candidatus Polarisedimenticolaceae bacterium]
MIRGAAAALVALALAPAALAGEDEAYARGSLAWFSSARYELLGTLDAEVPLATPGDWRVAVRAGLLTAIENASGFTFAVGQIDYRVELAARRPLGRGSLELFAGEHGFQVVDDAGRARVREAGIAWASPGFFDAFPENGFAGRAAAAYVFESHGVDASATAAATVRFMHRLGAKQSVAIGVDASADALIGNDHGIDWLAGPRLDVDLGGNRRFGLFARWLSSRNPLGLGTDGLLAGFDLAQGPRGPRARPVPPEIAGLLAAGGGDAGRASARFDLRVASPPFLGGTYGEIEVDSHVLTSDAGNDLYYLYDAGIAHPLPGDAWRAGLFFHHRSNHLVDGFNPSVTSIDVLEGAIETKGFLGAEPALDFGRAGGLDLSFRAGWLIDSAFGEDESWHARGAIRWATPPWHGARLYLAAAAERGDIASSSYGLGALLPSQWDVRVEIAHDEQLLSGDTRGIFGIATRRF